MRSIIVVFTLFLILTSCAIGNKGITAIGFKNELEISPPVINQYYSQQTINYNIQHHTRIIESTTQQIDMLRKEVEEDRESGVTSIGSNTRSNQLDQLNERLQKAREARRKWEELLQAGSYLELDFLPKYYVSTPEQLVDLIGSNRQIILNKGEYIINPISIRQCINLVITSNENQPSVLKSKDVNRPVIILEKSKNIYLENLIIGHVSINEVKNAGYFGDQCGDVASEGAVIRANDCMNVEISNCALYGCGTVGLYDSNSEKLSIFNSEIYECTHSAIMLYSTKSISISNTRIYNNTGIYRSLIECSGNSNVHFLNNDIHDNSVSPINYPDWTDKNIFYVRNSSNLVVDRSRIFKNYFSTLANSFQNVELNNTYISDNSFAEYNPSGL